MNEPRNRQLCRRDLLRCSSGALVSSLLSRASGAVNRQPAIEFPTPAHSRLAVTSYPFRGFIDSPTNSGRNPSLPGMDLKQFPAFVAKKFGVFNINPLVSHFSSTNAGYLDTFHAAVNRANSHIVDLGLGGAQFYAGESSARQAAVEFGRRGIDIAVQVGSPSVRQHVEGKGKPDVGLAAESLGRLAEYGAKRNIVINLENDDPVSEDPFFLISVIEKAANPFLRALPDFGNCLVEHGAEYNQHAIAAMFGHAFNMSHVKDSVIGRDGKPREVDLGKIFSIAHGCSYRGFFSMEYDTDLGDPIAGTAQLVKETLQYLT